MKRIRKSNPHYGMKPVPRNSSSTDVDPGTRNKILAIDEKIPADSSALSSLIDAETFSKMQSIMDKKKNNEARIIAVKERIKKSVDDISYSLFGEII